MAACGAGAEGLTTGRRGMTFGGGFGGGLGAGPRCIVITCAAGACVGGTVVGCTAAIACAVAVAVEAPFLGALLKKSFPFQASAPQRGIVSAGAARHCVTRVARGRRAL